MKNYAIILASGQGSRFGGDVPKQFIKIDGKTVLEKCVEAFEINNHIDKIIVVIHPDYRQKAKNLLQNYKKVCAVTDGGKTRKESSYNGVFSIIDDEANVFIHDCARPFISQRIIDDCASAMEKHCAVTVAVPVTDTIIEKEEGIIKSIPNRKVLMKNQTPQCFKLTLIKKAHQLAIDKDFSDDCSLVINADLSDIFIINGEEENIKITYKNDI